MYCCWGTERGDLSGNQGAAGELAGRDRYEWGDERED